MSLSGRGVRSLAAVAALAVVVLLSACERSDRVVTSPGAEGALRYLVTAHQDGPVAFRDPLGAVSPDGSWIAYTEHRRVHVQPIEGGAIRVLGDGERTIRFLSWMADSRSITTRERTFDRSRTDWFVYDIESGSRDPLYPEREWVRQPSLRDTVTQYVSMSQLDQVVWGGQGRRGVGIEHRDSLDLLWVIRTDLEIADIIGRGPALSFPAWTLGLVGCISGELGTHVLRFPCTAGGPAAVRAHPPYGPLAFSPGGERIYYATPNDRGVLELWSRSSAGLDSTRLATFARDAYAPSVAADGRVVFKTQDYRVSLAVVPADGGPSVGVTRFQSETPTWHPDGQTLAFTFGDWRRVVDDLDYPDIDQHIGMITLGGSGAARTPDRVFRQTESEDQGLVWSPNGRWVAFHTHARGTDDVFVQAADGSGEPVQISVDGSETGWPRWSPDGQWIVYPSYRRMPDGARRSDLYVVGVDQESGRVVEPQRRVPIEAGVGDALQAEWTSNSEDLVFESATEFGAKALYRVPRTGGVPRLVHPFASDQVHSGVAVSPDDRWVAFIAPDARGYYQVFRVPLPGGVAEPVTTDPSHKTQPAYSPDGLRLAFTVWRYDVHFWMLEP